MPLTPCPRCGKLGRGSYCHAHRPAKRRSPSSSSSAPDPLRRRVRVRDGDRCRACGGAFHPDALRLHHLRHVADGSRHTEDNLVQLCTRCHDLVHGAGRRPAA